MFWKLGFTIVEICQKLGMAKPEGKDYFKENKSYNQIY